MLNHKNTRLKQISVSGNKMHIWGVSKNDKIYYKNFDNIDKNINYIMSLNF